MARLVIVGSRGYPLLDLVRSFVQRLKPETVIVSGGARGIDSAAEAAALERGSRVISIRPYEFDSIYGRKEYSIDIWSSFTVSLKERIGPPCFRSYGQAAMFRNGWIVGLSDGLVAFWDGKSRGTRDSIERANRSLPWVRVYGPDGQIMMDS